MTDTSSLAQRLKLTASRIETWRREAARLRAIAGAEHGESLLVEVEEMSGAIYREIAEFDALVAEIDTKSHAAAGDIAEVGDALRLVLMEITELSLIMYRLEADLKAPATVGDAPTTPAA